MLFFQLNQKKAFVAAVELGKRLEGKENVACLLTEPFKHKEKLAAISPGMKTISAQKNIRAAIVYKSNFDFLAIESLTNGDCATGLLKTPEGYILVASVYLDINLDPAPAWLSRICEYASVKNYKLIMGLDSNAHSVLYLSLIHI